MLKTLITWNKQNLAIQNYVWNLDWKCVQMSKLYDISIQFDIDTHADAYLYDIIIH